MSLTQAETRMNAIDRLVALEDLRLLKARYFRFLDSKQWTEWSELFEPDIVADFDHDAPGLVYRDRDSFVSAIRSALGPALTLHHGHTPELEVLGPDAARGVWTMQDWLYWPEGGNTVGVTGIQTLLGWGHYHETYRKTGANWRIATLKLTRMHRVTT
jgi:hypothetical protein